MRQLKHPNIITLQDIYETDSELILVLELYVFCVQNYTLFRAFTSFRSSVMSESHIISDSTTSLRLSHYFLTINAE